MRPERTLTVLTAIAALILLSAGDCSNHEPTPPVPRPPIVRGLADIHNHQFAHLGFGGHLFSHDIEPNTPCSKPLGFDVTTMRMRDLVRKGLLEQATDWYDKGYCPPTFSNMAGQQVDTANLKRAWRYGLRLMVMFAVNSEFLCKVTELSANCEDMPAIDAQLRAAYDLQNRLDGEAGGPGQGWYRVVTTPEEARAVIADGKLAVVLGVESADAFGCGARVTGTTFGVLPIFTSSGIPNPEKTYTSLCPPDLPGAEGLWRQRALAKFEHYWDLGARHFYPVHTANGIAGGTALGTPLIHAFNNPSGLTPSDALFRGEAIDRTIREVRPPLDTQACNSMDFDQPAAGAPGICNQRGLTEDGKALVDLMASYAAIIDIDHMSLRMKGDLFEYLGTWYGYTASHAGAHEINHEVKRNEGQLLPSMVTTLAEYQGGFGIILKPAENTKQSETYPTDATVAPYKCGGTTEAFIQTYRYLVKKIADTPLQTGFIYVPDAVRPVGVAFGSDFNGLAGWPRPRIIDRSVGGGCYFRNEVDPSRLVSYPFTSPLTGESFDKSSLPWEPARRYDISTDGVAHVGMLPDMVEEMRVLGLTDADLEPLWLGAEQYLRAWEHTRSAGLNNMKGPEINNGIREQCRTARAELLTTSDPIGVLNTLRATGCQGF